MFRTIFKVIEVRRRGLSLSYQSIQCSMIRVLSVVVTVQCIPPWLQFWGNMRKILRPGFLSFGHFFLWVLTFMPPVRRDREDMNEIGCPCHMADYGTPLDGIFLLNRDSVVARAAADGWLRILASEGHDRSAYLREEFILRAEDMHFTHASISPFGYNNPRRLFFELGDRPCVFWDWWIDPTPSISLLREELKCLTTTSLDWLRISRRWEECWPFTDPKWCSLHQGYARRKR